MIRARFVKSALAALALAAPAYADEAPAPGREKPPVIGFFDGSQPHCYTRVYDAAHLAAHPKQKVTALAFIYVPTKTYPGESSPQPMWDQWSDKEAVMADIAVTVRDNKGTGFGMLYCTAGENAKTIACGVEGDGGSFTISDVGNGKLMLINPHSFTVEREAKTADDAYIVIDQKDDQTAFLLEPGKGGLCDAQPNLKDND